MTDEELIALADRLEVVAPKRIPGTSNDFAFRMDGLSLIDLNAMVNEAAAVIRALVAERGK